ncbi:hypothetical protein [Halococcus sediminicola]|uniref:hypothetical protein n=1 Tax=Halococcus sediminicola TaxID=1264579 RepID=UPI0012ABBAE4|nr:hypothetical protein [Halococcus sediminicola]
MVAAFTGTALASETYTYNNVTDQQESTHQISQGYPEGQVIQMNSDAILKSVDLFDASENGYNIRVHSYNDNNDTLGSKLAETTAGSDKAYFDVLLKSGKKYAITQNGGGMGEASGSFPLSYDLVSIQKPYSYSGSHSDSYIAFHALTFELPNTKPSIIDTDYEPQNPQQSDTVYLKANVSDPDQNLDTVTATVTESGNTVLNNVEMTLNNGLYEASFNVTKENKTYTVTYTATDTKGATDTTQETIAVPLNNDDPELGNLSRTPKEPKIYDSLSFSADATDSDTNLAGLNFTLTRNGKEVVHRELSGSGIYDLNDIATAEPGSYTAKYVAYDAKGSTDTKTQSFTVADPTTGVSITLRDAPSTQSFSSIQSSDSTNITVENGTVKEDGTDATYMTQQINSDQFDLAAVHMSGTGTLDVENLTGNETTAITQSLVSGANTVDLSSLDTEKIRLKVKLDSDSGITGLQVYGEDYSGGWFGGIVGPTGGFLSNVPVFGEFLNGVATGISNAVNAVLSVPQQMLEGILEVLPTL